jgi:hypothetical protein
MMKEIEDSPLSQYCIWVDGGGFKVFWYNYGYVYVHERQTQTYNGL